MSIILLEEAVNHNPSYELLMTAVATLAALISVFISIRSNILSNKALRLSNQEYEDKQSNFQLYLIDSFRWIIKSNQKKIILLFHITVRNSSDTSNSFRAELEIEYIKPDNSIARVITPHNQELKQFIPNKTLSLFQQTIRVPEKGMESNWLLFEQPESVFTDSRIDKYAVRFTDTKGIAQSTNCFIIKDLDNEV